MDKRMALCVNQKLVSVAWLIALLCVSPVVFAQETTYDSALWVSNAGTPVVSIEMCVEVISQNRIR
jgi:hypothetical protein